VIEEFVSRDGTDYGLQEHTLQEKKSAVARLLERGEVVIVFDSESETCSIVRRTRYAEQVPQQVDPSALVRWLYLE